MSAIHAFPSPMPASTSARQSRSPAGSTICASPARSCFPNCATAPGIMQCVGVKSALPEETLRDAEAPDAGISLIVTGKIRAEQRAPGRL